MRHMLANLFRPLREANPRCLAYKADTRSLNHYVIVTYNDEKKKTDKYTYRKRDKGITQIQSWLEESYDFIKLPIQLSKPSVFSAFKNGQVWMQK